MSRYEVFLRSLALRGFKSFADKTALEFAQGISVIVGPNGSGKSNIADAIAWVLGEQGPRALRGGQMTDVIFAGSPERPGLGLAEVKLTIDNTAGLIPIPSSEIEISRTIYRSGDNEYRLGGRPCRLLDIQEVLSDTGIGRGQHAVVGQGQLEEVLSGRPEDRRQLIEEAAGISKHRRRKERAERKLAGLEQDLARLQDVVAELRRRLKPLRQQAELAARHEELSAEAEDLSRRLAATRLRDLFRDREGSLPEWRRAETEQREARDRLDRLGAEIERLERQRADHEADERRESAALAAAMRAKSDAEARLRWVIRAEAQAGERLARATIQSGRLFALEEELERTRHALSEVEAMLASREEQLEAAERTFREAERNRERAEAERRRLEAEAGTRRAELETLRRALAAHESEGERLSASIADVEGRLRVHSRREEELEAEIERLDAFATPLADEQAEVERTRRDATRRVAELEAAAARLLARQEVLQARTKELSETSGTAFASTHRRGDVRLLRDLLEVDERHRPALVAALASFADAVVVADQDDALADVALAPGVPLAWDPPGETVSSVPGERRLLDVIRVDPRVSNLAEELLGDVYLVSDLEEARAKAKLQPRSRYATPDGVLLGRSFVWSPAGTSSHEDLVTAAADAEEGRRVVDAKLSVRRERLSALSSRGEEIRRKLEGTDAKITEAAEKLAATKGEVAALRRERASLEERRVVAEEAAREARQRMDEAAAPLPEPPFVPPHAEPPVHLRVEVEALRRERSRLAAGCARATRDVEALASEDPQRLREALAAARAERGEREEALREAEERLAATGAAHRAAASAARETREREVATNRAWRDQAAELERLRLAHEEDDRRRLDLERRISESERLLRDGHRTNPAEAIALAGDDQEVDVARRAELVARRLALLGRVNALAAEEYDALESRHDFIQRELDDVKSARRDLERVVEEVDRRVDELFGSAFRDVAAEFTRLFERLFPGGEGRLVLTESADPLAAGVEIEARPGRKRVKRLSLLSGGERSLAALAFLFAIFRSRPSPFYLMDEVEAALDDLNLHRFLELVTDLAERSQVLLVTHQKRTMEIADVLYGVSMGKGGASTVISQRLAAVAAG